jgi:serine/threonine protein kinase
MEFGSGLNLEGYLRMQGDKLSEELAKAISFQVIDALNYCHENNIVHRDLKADNILIDPDTHTIKLIDFGFAALTDGKTQLQGFCGTPNYMSPEIIKKLPYDGKAADIWAMGILAYKLLSGAFPCEHPVDKELYKMIVEGRMKNLTTDISKDARDFTMALLARKAGDRLTSRKAFQHKWFV